MSEPHSKSGFVGSILAIGDGKGAVRMEDVYDTSADDLWSALTDPDRLARWIGAERGIPIEHLPGHGAGWQTHVEDLAAHLAGRQRQDWHARWLELMPSYEATRGEFQ